METQRIINLEARIRLDNLENKKVLDIVSNHLPDAGKVYPYEFLIATPRIDSRPFVEIFDNLRNEKYTIPLDLLYPLGVSISELSSEYKELRNLAIKNTYDPRLMASMKPHIRKVEQRRFHDPENPDRLCLEAHDPDNEMTPVMEWYLTQYSEAGEASYDGREIEQAYWTLSLNGAKSIILQKVQWDDEENLKIMVDSMSDPEALLSMLVLLDAKVASQLSSRYNATALFTGKSLPQIEISEMRYFLSSKHLNTYDQKDNRGNSAKMGTLYIRSAHKKVPVAIAISPSHHARNAPHDVTRPREDEGGRRWAGWNDKIEAERKANQIQWVADFRQSLEGTEWRVLEDYSNEKELFVTKIKPEQWSKIDAAVQYVFRAVKKPVLI